MVMKEALHHAQSAFFVSIVVVQWADLVICKTRMNSIYWQGLKYVCMVCFVEYLMLVTVCCLRNGVMNFGLIFETMLASVLCYTPGVSDALGTRNIRFTHWMPGIPFCICIFLYDEARKKLMRDTTETWTDEDTKQAFRNPGELSVLRSSKSALTRIGTGWLERNSFY